MNRVNILLLVMLLLISLGISTQQVKAYGNTNFTLNCPIIHLSGYSDSPYFDSTVGYYGIGDFQDLTTGTRMTATIRMTRGSGSFYTFDAYFNLLSAGPVHSSDQISVYIRDSRASLIDFRAGIDTSPLLCPFSIGSTTPPLPAKLKLITCAVVPLNFPGGVARPDDHLVPGNARYVDPRIVYDASRNPFVHVQVSSNVWEFIPPSCVGADVPVPMP